MAFGNARRRAPEDVKRIHKLDLAPNRQVEVLQRWLDRRHTRLPPPPPGTGDSFQEELKAAIRSFHGDYHPKNIIIGQGGSPDLETILIESERLAEKSRKG